MLFHLEEKDTYLGSQKDGLHVTLFFFLAKGGMLLEGGPAYTIKYLSCLPKRE
jgi:hypothetical protein